MHAHIPLHKVEKMRPFLQKYCKIADSLPLLSTLRKVYVPRLFELHYAALTVDETADIRDHSILNVLATVQGRPHLIGVSRMEICNHSTFSQAIIQSTTDVGVQF